MDRFASDLIGELGGPRKCSYQIFEINLLRKGQICNLQPSAIKTGGGGRQALTFRKKFIKI